MVTCAEPSLAQALIQIARDPAASLPPDDEAALARCIDNEVASAWFEAWQPSRDCLSLKQGNVLADLILTARAQGNDAEDALAEAECLARTDAWHVARDIARDIAARHDADLEDLTRREHAGLLSALVERIETVLLDADSSTPRDALSGGVNRPGFTGG